MMVTLVVQEDPKVQESSLPDSKWPLIVQADGLKMLLTLEHASQLAEKLSQAVQAIQDAEAEGPLPEYSPVRA